MFRRTRRTPRGTAAALVRIGAVLALPWVLTGPLQGQEIERVEEEVGALREALDEMIPELARLEPLAHAEIANRSRARAAAQGVVTDTFQVGPLTVVSLQVQRSLVEQAVANALSGLSISLLGAEASVQRGEWGVQLFDKTEVELGIWQDGVRFAASPARQGLAGLTRKMRHELAQALAYELPFVLEEWAGVAPLLPPGDDAPYTLEDLHRAGIAAGSVAVTNCFSGHAASCWSVLGFTRSDNPALEWYGAEELRSRAARTARINLNAPALALTERERVWSQEIEAGLEACLGGDAESCAALLRPGSAATSPLPKAARTALLVYALERGGDGAYARIQDAETEDVKELLHLASGLDPDALVEEWIVSVVEARPVVQEDLGLASAVSLLWIFAFGGAAAAGAGRKLS